MNFNDILDKIPSGPLTRYDAERLDDLRAMYTRHGYDECRADFLARCEVAGAPRVLAQLAAGPP